MHRESNTVLSKSHLVFGERYVSISVPGDFSVDAIKVALADSADTVKVMEAGIIIEEALTREIIFQYQAELTPGTVSATLSRFGAKNVTFRFEDLKTKAALQTLNGRTPDDVFEQLVESGDEKVVLSSLRNSPSIIDGHTKFDDWFFKLPYTTPSPQDILSKGDMLFMNNNMDIWKNKIRARLETALNDRKLTLSFLEKIKGRTDEHWKIFDTELYTADKLLSFSTATEALALTRPAPKDAYKTFSTTFKTTTSLVALFYPAAKEYVGILNNILNVVETIQQLLPQDMTGLIQKSSSNTVGQNNVLSLALTNEKLAYQKEYEISKAEIDAMRQYLVKDMSLVS